MRTVTVSLAGREYSIQQLPIKANRAWRERFEAPIEKLVGSFRDALSLSSQEFPDGKGLLLAAGGFLTAHLEDVTQILVGSIDLVEEAVFEYAPEIAADKERIETESFDDELIAAFLKVVALAYPFGQLLGLATSLGQVGAMTSPSSPVPSGASGKTSSTRSKRRRS
jgi:hypothetical protein